jgi:hypothetical protein
MTRKNIKISAKESLGYFELKKKAMVWQSMPKIITSKEISQISVVTAYKRNKLE